ncbi:glycosyltransferase family 39 protein [Patescibacteria group bacterium]|nr:glycosyltransferase family 39 protein [Patescibacteria group bacterium]MBU2460025.1 glycosyltransferase family 39 protein [Patescibacteria group bacterium]MBU2544317.1 glycosyltransferase family 39 protein [Patescibacteria group bacterium]
MKKQGRMIILGVIILLAVIVRFWHLGGVPPSPDWDEAALGYNAYSILKTARDEYGTFLPLALRSYDDYKPPLYMYLTVPSVAVFGLNTWAVRLPSAIFGILAVIGTYFLVKELFDQKLYRLSTLQTFYLPTIASLLLAISPWHIQFSRIAFEANIGITLNIWGAYLLLRGRASSFALSISAFLFGLSMYAYHSERIFVPLLVSLLAVLYWKDLWVNKRRVITAFIVGILTILPLVAVFTNPTTLMRLRGTSSLSDQTALLSDSVQLLEDDIKAGNKIGMVFDNRRIVWAKTVLDGYLSHFSFKWLFLDGDQPRHHAPDMGLLYLWELPFLLWGMSSVWKKGGKTAIVLFGWMIISPIPASVTTGLPHAVRTLVFLPVFQVFTAVGICQFIKKALSVKRKVFALPLSSLFLSFTFLLFTFNFLYYLHMYFVHMNREYSEYWQYGYKQAVEYAQENKEQYKKIVVSTKLEQPHMFFLFYTKYDPKKYLAEGGTASGGFAEYRNKFDVYEFRPIDWNKEEKDGSILYIGTPNEIPMANLQTLNYLNGEKAMQIADR